jgi:protein TonB
MTALALHFPERWGIGRWAVAAVAIVLAHGALIAALVLWYTRTPPDDNIIPAIVVSLVPAPSSSPSVENQDVAVGPPMQEIEETPPEPPKVEEQKPVEQVIPPPPPVQQAEVTLPKPEPKPKPIEKPKPAPRPPQEAHAPPPSQRVAQFSQAAANAYNSLVYGHLQRYKRYPTSAGGASGTVVVRFTLNRAGDVVSSAVTKSSGSDALDQEALAILRRASPFPAFPSEKSGSQDSFVGPINFSH